MPNTEIQKRVEPKKFTPTQEQLDTLAKDEQLTFTQTADDKGIWEMCMPIKVEDKVYTASYKDIARDKNTKVRTRTVVYSEEVKPEIKEG